MNRNLPDSVAHAVALVCLVLALFVVFDGHQAPKPAPKAPARVTTPLPNHATYQELMGLPPLPASSTPNRVVQADY
jgi:hypothetical protein